MMKIFDKSKSQVTEYLEQCVNRRDDDWNLIIYTCEKVNATENGAKEAAKFVRKKLLKSSVNVQNRTLSVLKAMAEHCGAKFHAEIASKKFLDDIELVVNSQSTDFDIQKKIILLLGNLTEMFQNEPSLYQISYLYSRLTGTPIQKPPTQSNNNNIFYDVSKITEDIEVSRNNIQLLTQVLSFTDPEREDITKNELIQEFYTKCKSLHQSIMNYIAEMQDEQWVNTLLSVNQDFLNSFKMYEDMIERGQMKIAKQESQRPLFGDIEGAGVGSSSSHDPFADSNEVEYDPIVSGPSAKALGKMPASRFYDSTQNHNPSNNHSPLYNELPNGTSMYNELPKTSMYNELPNSTPIYNEVPSRTSMYNELPSRTSMYNELPSRTTIYNELPRRTSTYSEPPVRTSIYSETPKVPSSIYNDATLFEEEEPPASESQQQYSNIVAPLEPSDYKPPNSSSNTNGRQEHIII